MEMIRLGLEKKERIVKKEEPKNLLDLGQTVFVGDYPKRVVAKRRFFKVELQEAAIEWINYFAEKEKDLKNVRIISGIDVIKALTNWIKKFFSLSDSEIEEYNEFMREKEENNN